MNRPRNAHRWCLSLPSLVLAALGVPSTAAVPVQDPSPRETVAGGEVTIVPLRAAERASDGVPLPTAPRVQPGLAADTVVESASGDPFFLGFAAGDYRPPASERIDPQLTMQLRSEYTDGRPADQTYAFVMFSQRMTETRVAALQEAGARVLGFHPHYTLKVALAPSAVDEVSALPFVRWVGVPRPWQKVHPALSQRVNEVQAAAQPESIPVVINVYESDLGPQSTSEPLGTALEYDANVSRSAPGARAERTRSNGWQQRQLEALGFTLDSYHDSIQAFRATVWPEQIELLTELDWVQFVEYDVPAGPLHDESMPMINADLARTTFNGGATNTAVVGIVDSGLDLTHSDLNAFAVGWDFTNETDPFDDSCGHGSHVAGTALGRGNTNASRAGAAPGLGFMRDLRVFTAKIFPTCAPYSVDTDAVTQTLDDAFTDSLNNTTPRPHVVNNSWGSTAGGPWFGSEADARVLDNTVYFDGQLYVFSAGNDGPTGQTLNLQASAKNTLAVGNVSTFQIGSDYPGTVYSGSSRGPTADNRWGPQITAPGTSIWSVNSNTGTGYSSKTGTSMAAPHVTGVAAQLVDRFSFLRYNPSTLAAVLMASSIQKNDTPISSPSTNSNHHLNQYGVGRVEAARAAGGDSQQAMYFWGFTQDGNGFATLDFPVNPGATKLTVVMTYHDIAASAGASRALINDLDMRLDAAPFNVSGTVGEYTAQISRRDNTEVRILNSPPVNDYRIKIFPHDVPTNFFPSKVGVCAIVTYGDTTPAISVSVAADKPYVSPNESVEITASISNPTYVASAVFLETSANGTLTAAGADLLDGSRASLIGNSHSGRKILLGDILHGDTRTADWTMRWPTEGVKTFSVTTRSDNANDLTRNETITVDGTAPAPVPAFWSTSHTEGAASCNTLMRVSWGAASDNLSGIDGYRMIFDHSPNTTPGGPANHSGTTYASQLTLSPHTLPWFGHIVAIDRAGNRSAPVHVGPFSIATGSAQTVCVAAPHSAGPGATMSSVGSTSIQANDLVLVCSSMPSNKPSTFFFGTNLVQTPFGDGFRCAGGQTKRLPTTVSDAAGVATFALDFPSITGNLIQPGVTRYFQCWFRDPMGPGGSGFNLSNARAVTFCE